MIFEELGDSARALVRSRARAFGDGLTDLAREYSSSTSHELVDALANAPRDEKSAIGLLLARVALEEAVTNRSRELFSRFLFRFGAHLKSSVSEPGMTAAQRLTLATAAEKLFDSLPTASANQRSEISAIRNRLAGPTTTDRDWKSTLGMTSGEFVSLIDQFSRELGDRRRTPFKPKTRPARVVPPTDTTAKIPTHQAPGWLTVSFPSPADPLVAATANWVPNPASHHEPTSLTRAWSAFAERKYAQARSELDEVTSKLHDGWGPTSSVDAMRAWNWIRLVSELASIESKETGDVRRSSASACAFAHRCVPDDSALTETLLEAAIGDLIPSDMASARAWSAYTVRLVAELGHETALARYSNADKAALRQEWAERYGLTPGEARSTASAVSSIVPAFKQASQKMYLGARQAPSAARVLREGSHQFVDFLDEFESATFEESLELVQEAERLIESEGTNHRDLRETEGELTKVHTAISSMGSAVLQDFLAPLIAATIMNVRDAVVRLGDISRPEVSVQLSSSKVPFSAAAGSKYQIRFVITNSGNASAEGIALSVTEPSMGIDSSARMASLGPGAQAELSISVIAAGSAPKAVVLNCELEWTDALLQQFTSSQLVSAEDQRPVAWTTSDVNPFSLGTISDPARLVGRADDLASLDALLAGRASAYVTGHKRVGKTSLTRVLLNSARTNRGWAGSLLPLGRALGQDQTAGDLVYALLDEILDAARSTYGRVLDNVNDIIADESGNFARAANKWLRSVARALPEDARVVVAIDDFDELPPHLIDGPQADALFLFLRSLVDEPWLNLIVVGSEILPTIIQAQAHKLNQVVPVSVTNFASRASTAELLQSPTAERLEWLPEAIDRVHFLCTGNPYYETLLAQRLWQTMREQSRSVVMASDVDEAATSVARDASDSHFIHLWADSSSGLHHTSRSAIVASAVLRSIARSGGDSLAAASPEEVTRLAQGWIQTATTEELLQTIASLQARQVVRSSGSTDRLLISIPLVGVWLQGAGGRALDGVYANSKHATATVRMITDIDLVGVAKQLRYRGEQVTEIRIKAWLEQFGGNDRQYLAFKMLRRMILDGYFTSTRLQNTELPRLVAAVWQTAAARLILREANNQNLRNALLVDHGVAGDSTQGTLAALAKALKIKKANIVKPEMLPERIRSFNSEVVLFLLDDYCGTGTHLGKELEGLVDLIMTMGEEWVEKVSIVVGASVVADEADLPSSGGPISVEHVGGTYLGDRYRSFSPDSGIFDTAKEREDAEAMTASIGKALMANNPLGFGGRALLTLFEFNCPNNVAPIFWRAGTVSGTRWIPLFERAT